MVSLQSLPRIKKSSKRIGRGNASGKGTYSGRGCNGQNSRSGGGVRLGFEWGQSSLFLRMPKLKGFKSHHPRFVPINFHQVNKLQKDFQTNEITFDILKKAGFIWRGESVKILWNGDIPQNLIIHAHAVSKSAREKAKNSWCTFKIFLKNIPVSLEEKK